MTHRRKAIRDAFASAVTGLTATGARVYKSRLYALASDEMPALRIYTPSDTTDAETIGASVVAALRRVRIVCEAVGKASSASDDAVDEICKQVETALTANPTLSGAVLKLQYIGFEQELNIESEQTVVIGRMTFEAIAAS